MNRLPICKFLTEAALAGLLIPIAACTDGGGDSPNVFVTNRRATFQQAAETVLESSGTVRVTVRLTNTSPQQVSVPFSVSGSTTPQADYTVSASPLVFPPGASTRDIAVNLIADETDEVDETVVLTLGAPTGATLGNITTFTLRVDDDDAPPTVEFAVATQSVSEAAAEAEIGVQLSNPSSMDVSVPFTVMGSARDPDDYSIDPGPFVIPAGSTTASITLTPADDAIQEATETIELTLGAPTNATLGAKTQTSVLLQDDEGDPLVGFLLPKQDVDEDAGELRLALQLFALSGLDVTVPFTVNGTALDPDDYTISPDPAVIPAGESSVDIVITLVDDALDEAPESVEVILGTPTNAELASITANTTTILDQDPAPLVDFTLAAQSFDEAGGPQSATLQISAVSAQEVQIPLVFTGTAEDGVDYSVTPNPAIIPAGQTSANVAITLLDDALFEGDETLVIRFGTLVNATPGAVAQQTITITDGDATPSVAFVNAVQGADENAGQLDIEVRLSAAAGLDVTVPFLVAGSATAPADYTIGSSPLVIPAGDLSTSIPVTLVDDALAEMNETVRISLTAPTNATLGANALHTLTILDNEATPKVSFTAAAQNTSEAGGALSIALELSIPSGLEVSVPFAVSGSADQGPDFAISASPVVFPAGSTSANILLTIADDSTDEPLETIEVSLGTRTNADLGAITVHTISVVDNDDPPVVQFSQPSQALDEGDGVTTITVELSAPSGKLVTVPFTLTGAAALGVDYTLDASPVSIPPGQSSVDLTFTVIDDTLYENDELARVTLGAPNNATLGATTMHAAAIIENDQPPRVEFSSAAGNVNETAGSVSVAVQLSAVSGLDVIVPFVVNGGTATAFEDYGASNSPLVIPAGAASRNIVIPILDDSIDEPNENFLITLGSPTNAALGNTSMHTVTIIDEDGTPTVELTSASQTVPEAGGSVLLNLQLSAASGLDVIVPFALVDGTAVSPADYGPGSSPAVIPAGLTTIAVAIPIVSDALDEPNESFQINLGTPTNAGLGATSSATVTILDDDDAPTVEFTTGQQDVGEGAGPVAAVVTLSAVSGRNITVPYTLGGTASNGVDYSVGPNPVFIPAGQLSRNVVVTPIDDLLHEVDEPARLILQTPQNATLGATDTQAVVILDDDPAPTVRLATATQTAGEGDGAAALRVELSAVSGIGVSVPFTLGGGTATQGVDYGAATSPVLIPSGETFADIVVPILDDTLSEGDESFDATLGSPTNATLGSPSSSTVTIQDDDSVPTVEFATAGQSIDEGAGNVTLVATLSAASGQDVTVPYTLTDGTTTPADHGPTNSPLVILAGLTSVGIAIPITNDTLDEIDETFSVELGTPINANLGTTSVHTVTILDDDAVPVVEFVATSQSASEAAGTVTMSVNLSTASGVDVTVPYALSGITATATDDFDATGGALVIPAGQTGGLVSVAVVNDTLDEANETFQVTLGAPTNADLGASTTHTVTIIDEDAPPLVALGSAAQSVGEGAGPAQATVQLSAVSGRDVTVPFTLADGTATNPADYLNAASPLVIPAGTSAVVISVPIVDDSTSEGDETFSITLGAPTNATLGAVTSQVVTIVDDEGLPTVELTLAAQSVAEGDGTVTVSVSLSGVSAQDVTVPFSLTNGSATAPADYGPGSSPIVIPAGQISSDTTVPINDDSLDELDEFFTLTLGTPTNASLGVTTAQIVTILDDDAPPTVQVTAAAQNVGEGDGNVVVNVQLSAVSALDVSVPFTLADGSATSPADYGVGSSPILIPAGLLSIGTSIPVVDDALDELDETFTLTLGAPNNATLGAVTAQIVTILDDDAAPTVELSTAAQDVAEGAGNVSVTLELSAASALAVSVPFTLADGSAVASDDYGPGSSPVLIPAGQVSVATTISVAGDTLDELDETFFLSLGSPNNATLGAVVDQTITILDDDDPPTVQISASVQDVGEGAGDASVLFELSAPSSLDITVPFTLTNGTAVEPGDFSSPSSPVVISAGLTSANILVPLVSDILDEVDETFTVNLGAPNNATPGAITAQVITIIDDDLPPDVELSLATQDVAEAAGTALATVQLSAVSSLSVTVPYTFVDGTATAGLDYDATVIPVVIPAGSLSIDIGIGILDDIDVEGPETFDLVLAAPDNGNLGVLTSQTLTILDDDTAPLTQGDLGLDPRLWSMAIGGSVSLSVANTSGDAFTWTIEDGRAGAFLESAGLSSTANPVRFVAGGETGTFRVSVTNLRTSETEWATVELTPLPQVPALRIAEPAPWPDALADSVLARAPDVWGADYAVVDSDAGHRLARWDSTAETFEDATWKLPPGVEALPLLATETGTAGDERLFVGVRAAGATSLVELSPAGVERRVPIGEELGLADAHSLRVSGATGALFLAGTRAVARFDSGGATTALVDVPAAPIQTIDLDPQERVYLRVRSRGSDRVHVLNGLGIEVGVFTMPTTYAVESDEVTTRVELRGEAARRAPVR